jgi:hypothetical protein
VFEVSKDDSFACMESEFSFMFARRKNSDMASKGVEIVEVLMMIRVGFKGRDIMMGSAMDSIMFPDVILKGIRPETCIGVAASMFGMEISPIWLWEHSI